MTAAADRQRAMLAATEQRQSIRHTYGWNAAASAYEVNAPGIEGGRVLVIVPYQHGADILAASICDLMNRRGPAQLQRHDADLFTLDAPGYSGRVSELEAEGMTTSDAQAVADAEADQ